MIGVAHVLDVELPVAVEPVLELAENLHLASENPVDIGAHLRAEIVRERRRIGGERAEHEPAIGLDAQPPQPAPRPVEILRHPALAADALLEGDARQIAPQVVGPVMVDAGEALGVAGLVDAHQVAPVGAAVDHRVYRARLVAHRDDRDFPDRRGPVVPGVRDLAFQRQEIPGLCQKDPLQLAAIDPVVGVKRVGNFAEVFGIPNRATTSAYRLRPKSKC